ncbi:LacI family DNA-binding transcriptional regulator [Algimonas porphyrae]|uniref:LacI family transcriptional regulator n=1 Tax=Algimonas porphyrae TaxID=1128113 RepID=A0ABQ5V1H5_9PROT|nr:LacI family DNA-binding transcriptional regulator [Algimonas porphyrae]GLQ21408.1 LacI family transcriptional regulator [Algimonas porphyrae]
MATISEVAERAGVSVKTVSRVMNDYQHISEKTRTKVNKAMEELSYAPSSIARQMRLGDTQSIGMLYGDPSSGYQARLNHAVLKACSDARRYLAVEFFDEADPDWRRQLEAFLDRTKVRNLILVPPMCDSSELHSLLRERDVRTVLISPSRQISGSSSIAMDDRQAAMEMTNHFITLGHKNIAHISGDPGHVVTLLRKQGFREALKSAKISLRPDNIIAAESFRFKDAMACAETLLSRPDRPTAIFACNDEMAAAVIMVANRLGISVPGELSVAGFDNTPISETLWPSLTTVAQPFSQIAYEAVKLVSRRTGGDSNVSATHVLPHDILIRESTGPAPS